MNHYSQEILIMMFIQKCTQKVLFLRWNNRHSLRGTTKMQSGGGAVLLRGTTKYNLAEMLFL